MVADNGVEVVIPPPSFDLDAYQPFDDAIYRDTVDDLLSDEASFDSSFDEYSGGSVDGSVGTGGGQYQGSERAPYLGKRLESEKRNDQRARLSEGKKSRYFTSGFGGKATKKPVVTQRQIMRIESESENDEFESELEIASAEEEGNATSLEAGYLRNETESDVLAQDDGLGKLKTYGLSADDGVPFEEDAMSEPGLPDTLNTLLFSHPFMKEGGYPVGRCARRRFMRDLRKKADALGMDQTTIDELARETKAAYLETWAEGHTIHNDDPDGSEFGDEFDDEKERESQKERKRKRRSSDKSKKKAKDDKRRNSDSKTDLPPIELEARTVDIGQAMDILSQSVPSPVRSHNLDDDLVATVNPDSTNEAYDLSIDHAQEAPELSDATRNSSNKAHRSGHSDLGSESDPIPIDDESDDSVHDTPPVQIASAQRPTTVTEEMPSVQNTEANNKPHAGGCLLQVDSGLRGHPIPLGDNDDGSMTKTKENASKEQVGKNEVGNNELAKENHTTEGKSHELSSSERRKERNRRRRQRRRQRKRSAIQQNPQQTKLPSEMASGKESEGRLDVNGQNVNRSADNSPWKEPLRKHKALDDPFWDLEDF